MSKEAMKLALEALEDTLSDDPYPYSLESKAITALREALAEQPAQRKPWGFHIQFNNGKDATFKGLDYLTECEAHLEGGETITLLYIKENT